MYNLNINKSSVVPTNLIVGRVLDKPFDKFSFKIFDGLDPLDLTGATLDFRGVTPDNKKVISTAVKITDAKSGEIEFTIPSNFYSASGQFRNAYFRINKSGLTESTNDLLINVLNAVDLNLDDSQIIIDQLDKIIEDAIAKLDKELANVKLQISQVDGNIKALKKDVEDYKATFKVQMDAMQKQLDDLAKEINQTNIQRPQITAPNGGEYERWSGQYQLIDKVRQLGKGFRVVRATCDTVGQLPTTGVFLLTVNVNEISGSNVNQAHLYAHTSSGKMWYTYIYANRYRGWKQVTLDGQVHRITNEDGTSYNVSDKNVNTKELLTSLGKGVYSLVIGEAMDTPELNLMGTYYTNNGTTSGTFIGTSTTTGNVYSYAYASNGVKGWKRLDRLEYGIATQTQNGLLPSTDKKKLDGLKNYNNATQTTSGLMSSSDKVKLDNKPLRSIQTLTTSDINYNTTVTLSDNIDNYEYIDVVTQFEGNVTSSRNIVSGNSMTVNMSGVNLYNAESNTGWNMGELTIDITSGNRARVSRTKVIDNAGKVENNVEKIRVISIQGVNKLK